MKKVPLGYIYSIPYSIPYGIYRYYYRTTTFSYGLYL